VRGTSDERRLNGAEVVQIRRLGGSENFVSDKSMYSMRSVILSQRRIGVI